MKLNELRMYEAQIGYTWGIIIGALASWVFIMFFTQWEWYFKLFSSIGEVGIIGSLALSLRQSIRARRSYLDTRAEMDKINTESHNIIDKRQEIIEEVSNTLNAEEEDRTEELRKEIARIKLLKQKWMDKTGCADEQSVKVYNNMIRKSNALKAELRAIQN